MLQLKFKRTLISIIQAYAPTENSTEEEIDHFYETLNKAHDAANKNVIVLGDFNAKIGQPKINEKIIMGNYGYGVRSKRGELLISHAFQHKLSIVNTYFNKKENRRWTWISPDGKAKNEIDYILTNLIKHVKNMEVINDFRFASDHRLLRVTLEIKNIKKCRKTFKKSLLLPITNSEIQTYQKNLITILDEIENNISSGGTITVQTYYDSIEKAIKSSLETKTTHSKKRKNVLKDETKALIKRRTELLNSDHKDKSTRKELSELFKRTNRAIRKDYEDHRKYIIEKNLNKYRSYKRAQKELKTHKNWIQALKSGDKEIKTRKELMECATKFYKELYSKISEEQRSSRQDSDEEVEEEEAEQLTPLSDFETLEHIKTLKSEKSAGPDNIHNELLKISALQLTTPLTLLFNMIINTGQVPIQWTFSEIILLYKKGDPLNISNYRPISLLSNVYKLFTSILSSRISPQIDRLQPVEQAGFRSGFSTIDHIHVMEQLIEKFREFNKTLYIAFIDYTKAFDTISHDSIWNSLEKCGVNNMYIKVLKNIYKESKSKVKLECCGEDIIISRGVRQGDPISPKLFIAVMEDVIGKLDWTHEGINISGKYLSHLRFADDIAIFADHSRKLENMINMLDMESRKVGLEMNISKTKIMTNGLPNTIHLNSIPLEYVSSYPYLGKQVSFNVISAEEEVDRRINISWNKYWAYKEIMKGAYPLNLKRTVMDSCILPCLTYACQTWVYTKNIRRKIVSCQRAMERSLLHLRRIHKVKSDSIRKKTKLTDALKYALKLKWKWAGHVSRLTDERWTLKISTWPGPIGKRKVGRPKSRWSDDIVEKAGSNWLIRARDRDKWHELEEAYTQQGVPI